MQPKRVWGEITLSNPTDVVVGFSHDRRQQNAPFVDLYQWLEDLYNLHLSESEYSKMIEAWCEPDRWRKFFLMRIKESADQDREKAKQMQKEAGALQRRANKISSLV